MIIDLSTSYEFQLLLDPLDSSEDFPSVLFRVHAKVSMPSWQAAIESTGSWFSYESLNAFEQSLRSLVRSTEGVASLTDMDDMPVIVITRNGNQTCVRVTVQDSINMASSCVEVSGYASELVSLAERLTDYPKWW